MSEPRERRRLWRWLGSHALIAHLLVTVITVGVVFGVAYGRDRVHEAAQVQHVMCVQRWADETAERLAALAQARQAIDMADAELWRAVSLVLANPSADGTAQLRDRVIARVRVTDRYEDRLLDYPLPEPPRLACD